MYPEDDQQGTHAHSDTGASDSTSSSNKPAESVSAGDSGSSLTVPPPPPAPPATTPPSPPEDEADDDDEGMLRMSFLEHLEELRTRIIRALMGLAVSFVLCIIFANQLWEIVSRPAIIALHQLGFVEKLYQHTPMETFSVVWVKIPLLAALFLASPWILYQVWAFIAPGLYRKERRWAVPFVLSTAGLFLLGGVFAYFVAFRYGLTFLLGIGRDINIAPVVSVTEYTDLFVNVMLGVGLVFELPILIFFLTLLRIVTPGFLLRNSRYAILGIVVLAAVVTPTPDVVNLMLFAVPMTLLFYVGIFAGYLLVLRRENRRFPWKPVLMAIGLILAVVGFALYLAVTRYGMKLVPHWPFLMR